MSLHSYVITDLESLSDSLVARWNQLAANPLQRWEWLGSWFRAYQDDFKLCVIVVADEADQVVGIAPWCIENRLSTGQTLQFLGSGKACTDHLSLLVDSAHQSSVVNQIAEWMLHDHAADVRGESESPTWDLLELIGVDQDDKSINALTTVLREKGMDVQQSEGMGCYVIDLPESWEAYVRMRSKSGRREIRLALRSVDDGRVEVVRIKDRTQLAHYWNHFVQLHQRRRADAGTTGCFDFPPFESFLRDAAEQLLDSGLLQFLIASADGKPVAAQFAVADESGWYFYQSGMEPDAKDLRPGLSLFCHAIRSSIQTERKQFDMMRGDEAYKLRWRATLRPAQEVRVCNPRMSSRLRHQVYSAGQAFKTYSNQARAWGRHHKQTRNEDES